MSLLLGAAFAAAALWIWLWPRHEDARAPARTPSPGGQARDGLPVWVVRTASVGAGCCVWLLVTGWAGLGLGIAVTLGLHWMLGRLETQAARRRRLQLVRDSPLVADLIAAALAAGVPVQACLLVVGRAVGGPCEEVLLAVHRRLQLGETPAQAWGATAAAPGIGAVALALARSERTGAPASELLSQVAVDLRVQARALAMQQVRAASVRAVLPLGLCLLPAFMLLAVGPVIGGLLGGLAP